MTALMPFVVTGSVTALRRMSLFIPSLVASAIVCIQWATPTNRSPRTSSGPDSWVAYTAIAAWICALLLAERRDGSESDPARRFEGVAIFGAALGARAAWTAGRLAAVLAASLSWIPFDLVLGEDWLLGAELLLVLVAAALAAAVTALLTWILHSLLPRVAAVATSGSALFAGATVLPSLAPLFAPRRAVLFQQSPPGVPAETGANLANAFLALGSAGALALGLFSLLAAIETREPR